MDAKGKGKLVEELTLSLGELQMIGESSSSNEIPPLVATDHEVEVKNADLVLAQVENTDLVLAQVEDVANADLVEVENAHFVLAQVEETDLVLAQVDVDMVLAQVEMDLVLAQEQVEVENGLPEVGAHNIANVRGRRRRRPFSKTLTPRAQTLENNLKKKAAALKKVQGLKEARANAPNYAGHKKAQKPAFSKV